MEECALEGRTGTPMVIDMCHGCQAFWFDAHESPRLSPGSTLTLFSAIGARSARPSAFTDGDVAKCPRCSGRLRLTHDRQRNTAFAYLRCPNGHGRLIDLLRLPAREGLRQAAQRPADRRAGAAPPYGQLLQLRRPCQPGGRQRVHALRLAAVMLDLPHAEALLGAVEDSGRARHAPPSIRRCRFGSRSTSRSRAGFRRRARRYRSTIADAELVDGRVRDGLARLARLLEHLARRPSSKLRCETA